MDARAISLKSGIKMLAMNTTMAMGHHPIAANSIIPAMIVVGSPWPRRETVITG